MVKPLIKVIAVLLCFLILAFNVNISFYYDIAIGESNPIPTITVNDPRETNTNNYYYFAPDLIPFLNCTINDGTTCTAVFGYSNTHASTITVPLFNNKFSPAPVFRGQPTVFPALTTVFRAFNVSRPCSSGNLSWTLRDPITGITRTVTANTTLGSTCNLPQPVNYTCQPGNTAIVAQRLQTCQTQCGSQCTYCGQVYSFCENSGLITSNFTLETCMIVALGFNQVSSGCSYQTNLDSCCSSVQPPVPPVSPPTVTPISPPIEPPIVEPIAPPVVEPIAPPVEPPVTPQIFDCTDNDPILTSLETCQNGCSNCTTCDQVYTLCMSLGFFTSNSSLDSCMIGELSSFTTTTQCPFGTAVQDCCEVPPPPPNCGTTDLETYAMADACLSQSGTCSTLAIQCSTEILNVVNQDQSGYNCISTFIGLQSVNCQNGLATGYTTCCNNTIPEPQETPVCPLTTSRVLAAYECISRETTGPTCFDRVNTCDVFLASLTNETISTDCLNATVSESTNLEDCDFFINLIDCCNSTAPEPPVQSPIDVPIQPIAPPVDTPIAPPFPPPSSQCNLITLQTYEAAVACFTDTPTSCTQKGNTDCSTAINNLSTNGLTLLCLRQGTNTSTNSVNCDIEAVIENCCSPQAGQICPPPLGEGEAFSAFNSGTEEAIASFGYISPGNLTVVGNLGWSNTIYQGPTVATVTGVRLGGQASTLADINNALNAIISLPSTGSFPTSISGSTTFLPGIYKNTASTTIFPNAIITLDAQANPYAVFIFYSSFTINYGNNVQILLINGAHPSNVYFTTNTQQVVGSNTIFNGNFIKRSSTISNLGGNNIITGRLLSVGSGFRFGSGISTVTRLPNLKNPTC